MLIPFVKQIHNQLEINSHASKGHLSAKNLLNPFRLMKIIESQKFLPDHEFFGAKFWCNNVPVLRL